MSNETETQAMDTEQTDEIPEMDVQMLEMDDIRPNPNQPREDINWETVESIESTLESPGLINPISVRYVGTGEGRDEAYEINSGEQRYHAMKQAGERYVPAVIKDIDDEEQLIEGLIENVQRADLTAVEKGRAAFKLFGRRGLVDRSADDPMDELAQRVNDVQDGVSTNQHRNLQRGAEKRLENIHSAITSMGVSPRVVQRWLKNANTEPEVRTAQKTTENPVSADVVEKVSDIEDSDLQNRTYEKISTDDMTKRQGTKFVSAVEKLGDDLRDEVLDTSSDTEIRTDMLSRVANIEDADVQERAYKKIVEQDMDVKPAQNFVEKVKQLPPERQDDVLTEGVRIDPDTLKASSVPEITEDQQAELRERVEAERDRLGRITETPEAQERGDLRTNWGTHAQVLAYRSELVCPVCGGEDPDCFFGWSAHDLTAEEAYELTREQYQAAIDEGEELPDDPTDIEGQ